MSVESVRLKSIITHFWSGSREKQENLELSDRDLIPNLGGEHVLRNGNIEISTNKLVSKIYFEANPNSHVTYGDILLVKDGATIGKVGMINNEAPKKISINEHVYAIRSNVANMRYLYYVLKSHIVQDNLWLRVRGSAQPGLSSDFADFKTDIETNKTKQAEISKYLDYKIDILDKIIIAKKRIHDELMELRSTIVESAINNSPGEGVSLRRIANLVSEKRKIKSGDKIIMMDNVESWTGKLTGATKTDSVDGELLQFEKGDLLFNKLRPYLAKVYASQISGLASTEMFILRPNNKVNQRYLFHFLSSKKTIGIVNVSTYGVKMPRANWDFVGSIKLTLPSPAVQTTIVDEIDKKLKKIDEIDKKTLSTICYFEEYRTSLISNAVNGNINL